MTEITAERTAYGAGQPEPPASEQVKEKVHEAAEQVQQAASDLKSRAQGTLRSQVEERSSQVAEQLTATSTSLRQATGGLRTGGGSSVAADGIEQVAQLSERLGGYLRESSSDRILGDVEAFIRRRPWAAGGGGLVLGLLASRLLKASSATRYPSTATLEHNGSAPTGPRPAPALASVNRF